MDLHETDYDELKLYKKSDPDTYQKERVQRWKNKHFLSSLEFAVTGLVTAVKDERNMRKHLIVAGLALLFGFVCQLTAIEWLFLLSAVFLVIGFEVLNSAIENVVDLACDFHFSIRAKKAKDMGAGAVLLISVYAFIVGIIIFVPKLLALLF